jgi:hypothetical protein
MVRSEIMSHLVRYPNHMMMGHQTPVPCNACLVDPSSRTLSQIRHVIVPQLLPPPLQDIILAYLIY